MDSNGSSGECDWSVPVFIGHLIVPGELSVCTKNSSELTMAVKAVVDIENIYFRWNNKDGCWNIFDPNL